MNRTNHLPSQGGNPADIAARVLAGDLFAGGKRGLSVSPPSPLAFGPQKTNRSCVASRFKVLGQAVDTGLTHQKRPTVPLATGLNRRLSLLLAPSVSAFGVFFRGY